MDDRRLTIASRFLLGVFVLILIVSTWRQGVASYYFRQNLPDALQKSMTWDPANPVFPPTRPPLFHLKGKTPVPDRVIPLYKPRGRLSLSKPASPLISLKPTTG